MNTKVLKPMFERKPVSHDILCLEHDAKNARLPITARCQSLQPMLELTQLSGGVPPVIRWFCRSSDSHDVGGTREMWVIPKFP
jgi:hypothetical protein